MRVAGIILPDQKRIEIALTYIFGIGITRSRTILEKAGIDVDIKVKDITEAQEGKIRDLLQQYNLEGDLRRQIQLNVKRHMDIGSYRGTRHKKRLPVRGQRTKTNSRSGRGRKRQTVANKKVATK